MIDALIFVLPQLLWFSVGAYLIWMMERNIRKQRELRDREVWHRTEMVEAAVRVVHAAESWVDDGRDSKPKLREAVEDYRKLRQKLQINKAYFDSMR